MKISRFVAVLACSTALAALTGCSGNSPYMAPATKSAVETAPETATVVFVRPSVHGGADQVTLVDGKGRFLGVTMPATHFAVRMPPGEHLFVSWGENTSAVKATLAGGKVYFVEAYGPAGPGTPRLALRAVTLRSSSWGKIDSWLAQTRPLAADETAGQAYVQKAGGVENAIARANKVYAEYEPSEVADHTLTAEDGK